MWLTPRGKGKHASDHIIMTYQQLEALMNMRPDEFSRELDGSFRLWWD